MENDDKLLTYKFEFYAISNRMLVTVIHRSQLSYMFPEFPLRHLSQYFWYSVVDIFQKYGHERINKAQNKKISLFLTILY